MPSKTGAMHDLYKFLGKTICKLFLTWCYFRDKIIKPKTDAILIVAHPDDDTLFFHKFIKKHKPYVCLMTMGWSLRRIPCFIKTMNQYGVTFRYYDLDSRDTRYDVLVRNINSCLNIKEFKICATHGQLGEYGHEMHKRVHNAVVSQAKCAIWVPVDENEIEKYPLPVSIVQEKQRIFNENYKTELFVLDQYKKWIDNEHLLEFNNTLE